MGQDCLRDLALLGVEWELNPSPVNINPSNGLMVANGYLQAKIVRTSICARDSPIGDGNAEAAPSHNLRPALARPIGPQFCPLLLTFRRLWKLWTTLTLLLTSFRDKGEDNRPLSSRQTAGALSFYWAVYSSFAIFNFDNLLKCTSHVCAW